MNLIDVILIAIGLAMDCFAVSISQGMISKTFHQPRFVLMAVLFGLFQGVMPLIGYYAGTLFSNFVNRYAPWIALILLAFLGGKMIWESLHEQDCETCSEERKAKVFAISQLLILAVATSIDALATGLIFIPVPEILWLGISIIALVSFLFSIVGYSIGVVFGKRFKVNVELIGGIILVAIGLKIFIEGLFF